MRVVKNEPTETTKGMNLELLMKQNLKPLNWPQYGQNFRISENLIC